MGIEIHARSIFLQGLLVSNVNHIPKKLFFVKNSLIKFQKKIDNNGLNPVEASLFFVKNIKQIDKIIIGFTSYNEFKEIINKNKKRIELKNFTQFKITNKKVLNPTNW